MAEKTFVPQLVRLIRRLCAYIQKHRATMNPYLTTQQRAGLDAVVAACALFDAVVINEPA